MKNKDFIIKVVIVIIIGNLVGFLIEFYKKNKLNGYSKNVTGIYTNLIYSAYSKKMYVYKYYVNSKQLKLISPNGNDQLEKGDTVLIKYSIEDPNVGKVIDFCYMQKHKGKAYCDCKK